MVNPDDILMSRREMLTRCGVGMGALALANLMGDASLLFGAQEATGGLNPLAVKKPHYQPKAKRILHIFANGGASQVDTFDPKPALAKWAGKSLPTENLKTERKTGAAFPSMF